MPKRIAFITPAAPVLQREPPAGPQWIHEVKFDGWRMQLHKAGDRVVVFSRNGVDMTKRFAMIRDKVLSLPAHRPSSMPSLSPATATASLTSMR